MTAPNLFLTYVTDAQRSTAFYSDLFDIEPTFTSPRYVAFEVAPGVLFAIWTGHNCAVSSLLRHLGVMTSETFGCHDF